LDAAIATMETSEEQTRPQLVQNAESITVVFEHLLRLEGDLTRVIPIELIHLTDDGELVDKNVAKGIDQSNCSHLMSRSLAIFSGALAANRHRWSTGSALHRSSQPWPALPLTFWRFLQRLRRWKGASLWPVTLPANGKWQCCPKSSQLAF
jgi:hypothetical protein